MKILSLVFSVTLFLFGGISQSAFGQFCECPASTNLLSNPDFSLGPVGFLSDLPLDVPLGCSSSSYLVASEGRDKCNSPLWIDDTWDNTTGSGSGSYMIVNGPSYNTPPNIIWRQGVPVTGGETYTFYFHVFPKLSVIPSDLKLAFYVDGTNVSGNLSMPDISSWIKYCFEWTATSTSFINLQIRQVENFTSLGYDYGLDDFYFGTCEEVVAPCDVSANFAYDISPNDCLVSFTNLSLVASGTTIMGYHWEFGDGTSSDLASPTHYYEEPGIYEVCLTVYGVDENGECCVSKYCRFVENPCAGQPCDAGLFAIIYSINDTDDCILQFAASATPNREVVGWYWNFGDGETATGENPLHDYDGGGTYNVCVTMVLQDGDNCCSETFCSPISFTCFELPDTAVKPNSDPVFEAPTRNETSPELQIFPNPSKDLVEIQFTVGAAQDFQLQIVDLQGKLMLAKNEYANEGKNQQQLDIQKLVAGTYIVTLQFNDQLFSQKLIVL